MLVLVDAPLDPTCFAVQPFFRVFLLTCALLQGKTIRHCHFTQANNVSKAQWPLAVDRQNGSAYARGVCRRFEKKTQTPCWGKASGHNMTQTRSRAYNRENPTRTSWDGEKIVASMGCSSHPK